MLGSTDFQARLKAIAETEAMTVAGLKKWSIVPRSLTIKRKYVMRVSCRVVLRVVAAHTVARGVSRTNVVVWMCVCVCV